MPTLEEHFAEMQGKIDAVCWACVALIAASPHREGIEKLMAGVPAKAAPGPQATDAARAYAKGLAAVVAQIQTASAIAAQAELVRNLKPEGGH